MHNSNDNDNDNTNNCNSVSNTISTSKTCYQ